MYNPQLDTFLKVADAGSFNRAAAALYITAPAVIKQINLLEQTVGVPLFDRSNRGLKLTPAGESLYKDAKLIIQFTEEAIERAHKAGRQSEAVVRVGTSPMTPAQSLQELWPRLHPLVPDVNFTLIPYENTPENAREILRNLGKRIDVVSGVYDDAFLKKRMCAALLIERAPIRLAVSIRHPLAQREILDPEDLFGENVMMIHRGWNSYFDQMRDDLGHLYPKIHILEFDFFSLEVFNRCEKERALIVTIDRWHMLHPMMKTMPVAWEYTVPYGFLHAPEPNDTVSRFLEAVEQVVSDARTEDGMNIE